jgi:hypothetical protein
VRSIETTVEGDLDLRGTLGLDREVGAGFSALRLRFAIDAPDASEEELEALLRKTERYSHGGADADVAAGAGGRDVALTLCRRRMLCCAAPNCIIEGREWPGRSRSRSSAARTTSV